MNLLLGEMGRRVLAEKVAVPGDDFTAPESHGERRVVAAWNPLEAYSTTGATVRVMAQTRRERLGWPGSADGAGVGTGAREWPGAGMVPG